MLDPYRIRHRSRPTRVDIFPAGIEEGEEERRAKERKGEGKGLTKIFDSARV